MALLRSVFLALSIMLALTIPANAGPFEDGLTAYNRGDDATALKFWRPLAEQGNAEAQAHLGGMYDNGQGVPQDDTEAVKWYRMAAEQGNARAQFNLGNLYYRGLGVSQDHVEAVKWYRKAAEQGNANAQSNLGVMYATGRGDLPQDIVQAQTWFTLAVALGSQDARKLQDNQDKAAGLMTPDQIAEAQRMARAWMAKHQQ